MKIAIFASGRFHVCDLARELHRLGHEVTFYSYVPKWRTRQFGLPDSCNYCLLPFMAPLLLHPKMDYLRHHILDGLMCHLLRPCDLLIGMSGLMVKTALVAKEKYGARVWVERGSQHVLAQQKLVGKIADWTIERELAGYALADKIVVASKGSYESFIREGIADEKLFRNPYGVDLKMFPFFPRQQRKKVLMAGAWSYQKGCDLLVEQWNKRFELLHVGGRIDLPFPESEWFRSFGSVDQKKMSGIYQQARTQVLFSRQDGFGMTLSQGLASGLNLVTSKNTGGPDLLEMVGREDLIWTEPTAENIEKALESEAQITSAERELLSWEAYGRRYHDAIIADS